MKFNVIYINLSYEYCLSLFINNKIKILNIKNNFKLKNILYLIDKLLTKNNLKLNNINYIICITGPGKFISTRIGILLSIGLSIDKNIPIIYISYIEIFNYILKIHKKKIKNIIYIIKLNEKLCFLYDKKKYYIYSNDRIIEIILNINKNKKKKKFIVLYKNKKILKYIKKKYLYIKKINIFNIIYKILIIKINEKKINNIKDFNIIYN